MESGLEWDYTMMFGENPIYIISGEKGEENE